MAAEGWPHARLIPTYGIRSQEEQEKRATACLLAVMHGVPEFGHALLGELGAPRSPGIDTFAEVRFKNAEGKTDIPDGAIVCVRGGKTLDLPRRGQDWFSRSEGRASREISGHRA